MTGDWNETLVDLQRNVQQHGGFLTMQREALKEKFGIGRLAERVAQDLVDALYERGLVVFPHPCVQGTLLRIYDLESEVGKIARAVVDAGGTPETALVDFVKLHERANAGRDRRSDDAPWLSVFDVFLQIVIGRPPADWEDLDDDREPFQLAAALAKSLDLSPDLIHSNETVRMGGAVCACRPRVTRWEGAPSALSATLAEAARKQMDIFEGVLREAAKHLLGGAAIPSHNVELGRLGLRYRREVQGGI